jgi:hypothetical protein
LTDDSKLKNELCVPVELQQKLPRRIRLAESAVYYLALMIGGTAFSFFMLAFIVWDLSMTAKVVRNGREPACDGRLAYTGDVHSGGRNSATVYYSFTYNGRPYRGQAPMPFWYLDKINDYSKAGDFPVLFLPRYPSINHPYDWHDDESHSSVFLAYVFYAIGSQWRSCYRENN